MKHLKVIRLSYIKSYGENSIVVLTFVCVGETNDTKLPLILIITHVSATRNACDWMPKGRRPILLECRSWIGSSYLSACQLVIP